MMERNVEIDCDNSCLDMNLSRPRSAQPPDFPKKIDNSLDERIDSGFLSGDLPSLSADEENEQSEQNHDNKTDNSTDRLGSGSLDLTNRISKLNIDNSADSIDSGISMGVSRSSTDRSRSGFGWISSSIPQSSIFSLQQIEEIFRGDEDGDSHLHLSIIHGVEHIAYQIISLAPDWEFLNQPNYLLQTPLHLAVITRQAAVVRRLMCAGASVDVRDENGNTPLHNACRLGFEDIARTLLTAVLYEETYQNKYEIPFQRIPQDLDSRNYEGLTCLHLAAIGGHIHVMRLLLREGACVNTHEGKNGRTVLHMAADWGHIEMLQFLLKKRDTNIDAETYAGLTPITLAYGRNHVDAVNVLYKSGASYDIDRLNDESDMESSDDELSDVGSSCRMPSASIHQGCMQTCR